MVNLLIRDLRALEKGIREDGTGWPHIPCPTCRRRGLSLLAGSLVSEWSKQNRWEQQDYPDWDPSWLVGGFHCVLECRDSECEIVRMTGQRFCSLDRPPRQLTGAYEHFLRPLFFFPALPLVENFGVCPEKVRSLVAMASGVLWSDPSAAANRLRAAAEALMDDQGVPRTLPGAAREIPLDHRIRRFKADKPDLVEAGDLLLAVKWIGNVGSHESVLDGDSVLDGVEIFDRALYLLYDRTGRDVAVKASKITERRGRPDRGVSAVPF